MPCIECVLHHNNCVWRILCGCITALHTQNWWRWILIVAVRSFVLPAILWTSIYYIARIVCHRSIIHHAFGRKCTVFGPLMLLLLLPLLYHSFSVRTDLRCMENETWLMANWMNTRNISCCFQSLKLISCLFLAVEINVIFSTFVWLMWIVKNVIRFIGLVLSLSLLRLLQFEKEQ